MTQRSSLINWLVDFWKRCFADKYLVKAEGKSPKIHDFRHCAECGNRVVFLDPIGRTRCDGISNDNEGNLRRCKHILCENGHYREDGKTFSLQNTLHNPRISLWTIVTIILMMCMVSVYHFVKIPYGFSVGQSNFLLWYIATFNLFAYLLYYVTRSVNNHMKFVPLLIIIFDPILVATLLFWAMPIKYSTCALSPRWLHVPTEQEWQQQQLAEIEGPFNKLCLRDI